MTTSVLGRVLDMQGVPTRVLMMTVIASYGGLIIAGLVGWPLWALVLAAALPWWLVYGLELRWTYRHFRWLALFYLLVLTQGGHLVEHLAQMVQIHLLGLSGPDASGIFSRLDVEWVHFGFNTWILVAVAVLLVRYRSNPWLWLTLGIAAWHQVEHAVILPRYLATGIAGDPGLLSRGGLLGGGLPVSRPDLHFVYNVVETLPLLIAFGWALRHSHNEWLARAFPGAPEAVLVEATPRTEVRTLGAGETIIRQGDAADAFYILTRGEAEVHQRRHPDGEPEVVGRLVAGDHFGETGLLAAGPRTATVLPTPDVEVLRLDRDTFDRLVTQSQEALDRLTGEATRRRQMAPKAL